MLMKRFLFASVLLLVTISFTGTSKGTSGVEAFAYAFESSGLKNNFTEHFTYQQAKGSVLAANNYYGSYSGDASVPGDDDDMSGYYSGGVWDAAVAYTYYDGKHGGEVSGSGWARAHIIGTPSGSWHSESDNDNTSVNF